MKIGIISDLHGNWKIFENKTYDIELLIIAGDLCNSETVSDQEKEFKLNWELLINEKIFPNLWNIILVPGNHDYWLERVYNNYFLYKNILGNNINILVDKKIELFGIKFYGCPRTSLSTFAFPHFYNENDIDLIPDDDVDILITHEAPRIEELECIKNSKSWYKKELPGNKKLAEKVLKLKPKYHIFGHIHYPTIDNVNGITFINASCLLSNKIKIMN